MLFLREGLAPRPEMPARCACPSVGMDRRVGDPAAFIAMKGLVLVLLQVQVHGAACAWRLLQGCASSDQRVTTATRVTKSASRCDESLQELCAETATLARQWAAYTHIHLGMRGGCFSNSRIPAGIQTHRLWLGLQVDCLRSGDQEQLLHQK